MELGIDDYLVGDVHRKDEESHEMLPLIQNTKSILGNRDFQSNFFLIISN